MMELRVEGMSCAHGERAVAGAIRAKDPAAAVRVDVDAGSVRAETSLPRAEVAAAIEAEGYRVLPSPGGARASKRGSPPEGGGDRSPRMPI